MATENKKIEVGAEVKTKKYGAGKIVLIDGKENGGEWVTVYHVKLQNGEVRHFTAEDLA